MSSNRSKKIIIIGASSGIGREIACIYAAHGHKVVITGRRNELLDEIKLKYTNEVVSAPFDVTGKQNRYEIESIIDQLGGLDLLIYNAGFGDASSGLQWEVEDLTTRTNVNAFVEITGIAFNYFIKQGYGQIAVTSSVAALRGNSWSPAYSASKAFISNYAEGLQMKAARLKKRKRLLISGPAL